VILLAVGTESFSFHRLVAAVDAAAPRLGDEVFAQIGSSTHVPVHCASERLVPFERMRALLESASRVVCHAGAGTTLLAIAFGHVPVVLPRRRRFGEHVDDHQVLFAERLAERELVLLAGDETEVEALLGRAPRRGAARPEGSGAGALCDHLFASVAATSARAASATRRAA
jgi:UDP-N-acetylglucosamine transferase subunit ALG13